MRNLRFAPLLALLAIGCEDPSRTLVLLHTTDEHSHVLGYGPEIDEFPAPTQAGSGSVRGGFGRRAAVLERERQTAKAQGADTLTLSAGDYSMATLFMVPFATTSPDFTLMNQVGYDVVTLGNHEFDFGPGALAKSIQVARASGGKTEIVSTTLRFSATSAADDELAALYDESGTDATRPLHKLLVKTLPGGLKVGFVGTMGPSAASYSPFKEPVGVSVPAGSTQSDLEAVRMQMYQDLQASVDVLRAQKVDLVILISHGGVDTEDATKGEDYQIGLNVSGLDAIVSGHTHVEYPLISVTNPKTNRPVFLQQAGQFGQVLGKMVLKVDAQGKVTADTAASLLLPINDTIVAAQTGISQVVEDVLRDLEGTKVIMNRSFLEHTLSLIEGSPVVDDPSNVGDLFFRTIGTTDFDVPGYGDRKESAGAILVADAHLAAADKHAAGKRTDFSLVTQGEMRADALKGKTGVLGFSDVFSIVSLGLSPVSGTVGYPLVRVGIWPSVLKAALEISAGTALKSVDNSVYYMVTGGLKYAFDTARQSLAEACAGQSTNCQLDGSKGRVTKITLLQRGVSPDADGTIIFDAANPAWTASAQTYGWAPGIEPAFGATWYNVVTSYYVATFSAANNAILLDPETGFRIRDLPSTILTRPDGTEVKQWESLAEYIRAFPSGRLPARYNQAQSPAARRALCSGPLCMR